MKINRSLIIFTVLLVVLATACKYFFGPDLAWSGFSPVLAIAIFSGFIIRQKDRSFLLPLLALVISDAAIQVLYSMNLFPYAGFYEGQWKIYLFLLAATVIGWLLKGRNFTSLAAGAIAAPVFFFLISNFAVWLNTTEAVYPKTFGGLMTCYEAGIPFFRNSVIATIVFLPLILVMYNFLTKQRPALTLA